MARLSIFIFTALLGSQNVKIDAFSNWQVLRTTSSSFQDVKLGSARFETEDDYSEPSFNDSTRRHLISSSLAAMHVLTCASQEANAAASEVSLAQLSSKTSLCLDPDQSRINIFERVAPGVVFIDTFIEQRDAFSTNVLEVPLGSGSGFVWDNQGHIVTNYHVVRNAKSAQVAILTRNVDESSTLASASTTTYAKGLQQATNMRPGNAGLTDYNRSVYKATVIGVDPSKDVAVLKVNTPLTDLFPLELGTSKEVRVGQTALAIGNPFGLDHTLTSGIISGLGREVKSPTGQPISNVIQTDAAINPGNSGGPLLDAYGRLIGMNTAIFSPSGGSAGIGFAIPVDTVKYIAETLIRDGRVVRPIIGISYLESKQAKNLGIRKGVLVLDVPTDSSAYKAGMRGTRRTESGLIGLGDIIVKVADTDIDTEADLFTALESYKPGDRVKIVVLRLEPNDKTLASKEVILTVQLKASSTMPVSNENFHGSN
mmetsp:Transcript_6431/g.9471  ORF Transcript_6431/g.9471 Transcript_6431/m.9471 type:complete len:484 (+) Transcript_6431:66-1517(+)